MRNHLWELGQAGCWRGGLWAGGLGGGREVWVEQARALPVSLLATPGSQGGGEPGEHQHGMHMERDQSILWHMHLVGTGDPNKGSHPEPVYQAEPGTW